MNRTRMALAIVCAAGALTLSACGGSSTSSASANCTPKNQFDTIEKGTLTVAVYDLPPYAMTTGPDGMSGVDADILREFAKRECITVTPQPGKAAAMVPAVQQGRADVASGDWYRTTERSKIVNLTDPLYLDDMGIVSAAGVSTVKDMEGKKVGTVDGYLWVKDLQKVLGDNLKLYPSAVNMNQDIKAGRIEIGVDSYGSAVQTNKDSGLKIEVAKPDERVAASKEAAQATFPTTKDNAKLLAALNAVIADLHADGTITKILESHGLPATAEKTGAPRLIG